MLASMYLYHLRNNQKFKMQIKEYHAQATPRERKSSNLSKTISSLRGTVYRFVYIVNERNLGIVSDILHDFISWS